MSTTPHKNRLPLLAITMAAAVLLAGVTAARAQGPMPAGSRDSRPASSGNDPVMQSTPRWDANHDGTLTCDEWKQYAARLFKLADLNSDGFLDATEVRTLGRMEPLFAAADVGYFDGNGDNRISRPEFVDKPNPLFLRFDVNGDCKVTADEIKTTSSPGRQERGRSPGGGRGGPGGGGGPGGFGGNSLGGFGGGSPGGL